MREEGQIAPANGSMNHDFHPKFVRTDDGQVYSRTNLRTSSTSGSMYINKKIKGNVLIENQLPSLGINKTIGWCKDVQRNSIIYFVYNSLENHCVFSCNTETLEVSKLWYEEPDLGFEDSVLKAQVVEGKVYWVNGEQSPKGFNILYAYNYTNNITSDESYTDDDIPLAENVFTLIKRPPQFAPTCEYDSDPDKNFNNLRKRLFQFKYAYQYYDDQISAWSPISKVPLPAAEVLPTGKFVDNITVNNVISVFINTGSKRVKKVLIAARDTYPRNSGSFFLFETIEKYDTSTNDRLIEDDSEYFVSFYNDKRTESIDTEVGNRYCDWVPLSGRDITLIDGKYLSIAYPKQGYDPISVDYDLLPAEEDVDLDFTTIPMTTGTKWIYFFPTPLNKYDLIYIPGDFYENSTYEIQMNINGKNFYFSIDTGATYENYPRALRNQFIANMRDVFYPEFGEDNVRIEGDPKSTRGIAMIFFAEEGYKYTVKNLSGQVLIEDGGVQPVYKSLKRGQSHPFGIIYNDGYGRYNIVYGEKEFYSPLINSDDPAGINQVIKCQWQIRHRPPIWAKSYRWAYIRNKTYSSFQYFSHVKSTLGQGIDVNGIPQGKYLLELNQSLQRIRDRYPNFIISDYEWINGDRIRVVGSDKSYEILSAHAWVDPEDEESGVNGFLVDEDITDTEGNISLVEVYRSNPEPQDTVFFEIGEEYPILDAGTESRRHAGGSFSDQSADLVTPAAGIMDFGDVYFRYRLAVSQLGFSGAVPIEDEYYNDYYRSDAIDVGRIGARIDSKQKYLNRVVRSENYLENTEYNQLNVWLDGADYFDAFDDDGEIIGIEYVGDVLKVVQEHKETSIYVGKNRVRQGDNNEIVISVDKVFGTPNRYIEFRGTKFRNSLASNLRYMYFFDDTTGEFVRSSPNGQLPVSSDYLMESYFEAKGKELRQSEGFKDVMVGINNDYKEVYISFIIGSTIETVVFSEDDAAKGFKYFFVCEGAVPENYAWYGDQMYSFLQGALYLHDQSDNYNEFYGVQNECGVSLYVNKYASMVKRFKNIRLSTNQNIWDIAFSIPEGLNYGDQKSLLKPALIRNKDAQGFSDILRNIIDKFGNENLQLLYKGEKMTGEYMKVDITTANGTDVELREIEVKFLIST